ncbi:hypothetical protein EDD37DRAFT_133239 [Exophiala viscosa]|uniref:uncharacterized protein n=1 Tax=Exophiala viscosa TaxID=2486360 RepID=UPI0021912A8C|nr:hypothetical protein EDD37DRAFT_133239 [Exophiala viscosa]
MSTSTLMGTSSTSVTTTASTTHLVSSVLSTQQSSAPTTTSQTSTPLSTTAQMSSSLSTTRAPPSSTPTMSSSSATTTPSSSPATSHITSTSQTASQMSTVATSTQTTSSTGLSTTRSATTTTTTTTTASYCSATPTTTNLCPTYNHQALNVNGDGSCYEVECSTALQGTQLTGNSTTATSLKTCTAVCNIYNEAIPYGCVGVSFYNSVTGSSPNCILFSSITGTSSTSGVDSGRLMYQGYPSITDPSYAAITTTTAVTTTSAAVTSGTTTTSTTLTSCPPAPTASSCPGNSPYCYAYEYNGNTDDFEVECQTSFTGVALQAIIAFDFEDCAGWCQYANEQGRDVPGDVQGSNCVGFTFQEIPVGRLLFSGYPNMTDYSGSAFHC